MSVLPVPGSIVLYKGERGRVVEYSELHVLLKLGPQRIVELSRDTFKQACTVYRDPDAKPLPKHFNLMRDDIRYHQDMRAKRATGAGRFRKEPLEKTCVGCDGDFLTNDTHRTRCTKDCGRETSHRPKRVPYETIHLGNITYFTRRTLTPIVILGRVGNPDDPTCKYHVEYPSGRKATVSTADFVRLFFPQGHNISDPPPLLPSQAKVEASVPTTTQRRMGGHTKS